VGGGEWTVEGRTAAEARDPPTRNQ